MGPAVCRTRQGDGPILTLGTTAKPTVGYCWRKSQQSPHRLPPGEGIPNTHPQPLALAVSWAPFKSPCAGPVASMSFGGAATLLASRPLGSRPSACRRTAGKTQNNMYQESALGELISSHTWLWIAQHIPQDTAGEETLLLVTLQQHLVPALPSCTSGFTIMVSTSSTAGTGGRAAQMQGADQQRQGLLPTVIPGDQTQQNTTALQVQRHRLPVHGAKHHQHHHHWDAQHSTPSPAQ